MGEVCDKHGPYATICRECDLESALRHGGVPLPDNRPIPANSETELIDEALNHANFLESLCVDWDDTDIPNDGEARSSPTCRDLRLAAQYIRATSAARAAIARLSPPTDVEILRDALEPFAVFALEGKRGGKFIICKGLFEDMKNWDDSPPRSAHLHIDDFLRARKASAALSGHGK